jgi:hypothetical protein
MNEVFKLMSTLYNEEKDWRKAFIKSISPRKIDYRNIIKNEKDNLEKI